MIKKTVTGLGTIVSPIALLISRIAKSSTLAALAVKFDPHNNSAHLYKRRLQNDDVSVMMRFTLAAELSAVLSSENGTHLQDDFSDSKSQLLQDLVCLLVNNHKENGYFLEIGVGNGVDISNTYLLEKKFSWKGLLVEPNRSFHENIASNRDAQLDKRAASSQQDGQLEFAENIDAGEFSKLASTSDRSEGSGSVLYKVDIAPLNQILKEANAPKIIDFLSLDTEGTEIDILNSVDLTKYQFGFLAIEHNYEPGKLAELEALLKPYGYHRILHQYSAFDGWFAHKSLLSTPDTDPYLSLNLVS